MGIGSKKIGKAIKRAIINKMKMVDAAERLGISKQALNYMLNEKEDKNWVEWEIKHICEALRIDSERIMKVREDVRI